MKKSMYLLAMLMLGLSCALWTGCSDDDDDKGSNTEQGDDNQDGKDEEVVAKDTVYQVKTIKVGETNIELEYADGKVKTIKTKRGVNDMPDATVVYNGNTVTVNYTAWGMDKQLEYTLENGYAVKASDYDVSDPDDPYEESVYDFKYNLVNGMLETIEDQDDPDASLYMVTYVDNSKNWKTLACFDLGAIMDCQFGALKNNYTVDLNEFLYNYSDYDVINYAILCKLIPATENVIESLSGIISDEGDDEEEGGEEMRRLTKAGETVIDVVPTEENGQIKKLELKVGGQVANTIEFGY